MRAVFLLPFLLLWSCATTLSEKERELARVHLGLAQEHLTAGDPRGALAEVQRSVEIDPTNADARNFYGLLYHVSFHEPERAIEQYRKAIELRPSYSEAKVNLGAVYTMLNRCEEAIPLLEEVRADLVYREPYLAENNLGWCKYLLGDEAAGLRHLQAAIALNPGFCLGYKNIGQIHAKAGRYAEALAAYDRYAKTCPDAPDANYLRGLVFLEQGRMRDARNAFMLCEEKASLELAAECARRAALLPE